jgi:hypothetical protein
MTHAADSIDAIRVAIQSRLNTAGWEGPDGEQFRHEWTGRHARVLAATATGLREAARIVRGNADQQRGASGADQWQILPHRPTWVIPPGDRIQTLPSFLDVDFGQDLLGRAQQLQFWGGVLTHVEDLSVPLSRFADVAHHFTPGVLDGVGIGMSIGEMLAEASRGELQWSTVGGVAWQVATLNPYVAALDTGIHIGTWMANELDDRFGVQQGVVDYAIESRYGGELDPSEAADLTARYDGVTGYVNIAGDMAKQSWNTVTSWFK